MMGKRNKASTPSRTTQINLQTAWKKPNNSPTPVRLLSAPPQEKIEYHPGQTHTPPSPISGKTLFENSSIKALQREDTTVDTKVQAMDRKTWGGEGTVTTTESESSTGSLVIVETDILRQQPLVNKSVNCGDSNSTNKMDNLGNTQTLSLQSNTEFPPLAAGTPSTPRRNSTPQQSNASKKPISKTSPPQQI